MVLPLPEGAPKNTLSSLLYTELNTATEQQKMVLLPQAGPARNTLPSLLYTESNTATEQTGWRRWCYYRQQVPPKTHCRTVMNTATNQREWRGSVNTAREPPGTCSCHCLTRRWTLHCVMLKKKRCHPKHIVVQWWTQQQIRESEEAVLTPAESPQEHADVTV